jgi:hypothetical protein
MTLRITQSEGRWNFKFCDWSEGETSWVLLYRVDGEDSFHAWSSDRSNADGREQLIADVAKSTNDVGNKYDLIDAFMNQSPDWSFWGSGIPAPIADYYDSILKEELRRQLHS